MPAKRCTVKGCPWPKDYPHVPWCLHIEGREHRRDQPTHQHVPKKGMGGNNPLSKIVAILCSYCHDEVDNGISLGNMVWKDMAGREHYLLWDVAKGNLYPLIDRVLEAESAAADVKPRSSTEERPLEPATGRERVGSNPTGATPSGAAPSASGESSVAEPLDEGALPTPARDSRDMPSPSATPPSFNLDSWCEDLMKLVYLGLALRGAKEAWQLSVGDQYNRGEQFLGNKVFGYMRPFKDGAVRQYTWVAGCVSDDTRVPELSYTYYRAVAHKEPPEQKELLALALKENLNTKEFHRLVHGEKPRVKRWSFADLEGHLCHTCREVLSLMETG